MAKITGKNTRAGSNKATGRDYSKEKAYQSSPARNKYRAELNAEARERGIYGKRDAMGKDLSHKKDGKMVLESKSLNRRRQGANGKSTKK
jgi:ribosomal protein L28